MVNLHLATETPERPEPVIEHGWYRVLTFVAGALLGMAVMWMTTVRVAP
jgi:hypothetical protein